MLRMLKNVSVKVSLFPGTDITDAAFELCELSYRLGVLVEADFNDIKVWARPGDDPQEIVKSYHAECKRPSAIYKIAQDKRGR